MEGGNRRGEILDSGQAVFLLRGVRAATIDEITSRAGIAKGTFYLYFESKDALLQALRERYSEELLRTIEAALRKKNRGQALTDFITAVIDFKVRNRAASTLLGRAPEGFPAAESERAIGDAFARFLGEGVRAGDFEARDPQALAILLYGSLRAAFDEPEAADASRLGAAAQDLFRSILLRKRRKK